MHNLLLSPGEGLRNTYHHNISGLLEKCLSSWTHFSCISNQINSNSNTNLRALILWFSSWSLKRIYCPLCSWQDRYLHGYLHSGDSSWKVQSVILSFIKENTFDKSIFNDGESNQWSGIIFSQYNNFNPLLLETLVCEISSSLVKKKKKKSE